MTATQRRRRSSGTKQPPILNLPELSPAKGILGASSGLSGHEPLPPIPGTPSGMSLSRSPSPQQGGGWSSPGLTSPFDNMSGRSTPRKAYGEMHINGSVGNSNVSWATAKARSEEVNGYPSFAIRNNGFFSRQVRTISSSLPSFHLRGRRDYAEKEKLGRGRWSATGGSRWARLRTYVGRMTRRMRLRLLITLGFLLAVLLFYVTRKLRKRSCAHHC